MRSPVAPRRSNNSWAATIITPSEMLDAVWTCIDALLASGQSIDLQPSNMT
jgi:hypothetical protein